MIIRLLNLNFRPSSNLNIGSLLNEEDVEMVVLAGEDHEDNKTVIDDIFRKDELSQGEREPSSKPYHDLDLDLSVFVDKNISQKGQFHLGVDLSKYEDSSLKAKNSNSKDNRHSSYISDVMNMDSNTQQGRVQPRPKSPDSLDSFNFLLNEVGGTATEEDKDISTLSNPKHVRSPRQPTGSSAVKEKPPSIEDGYFDTDSFLDL